MGHYACSKLCKKKKKQQGKSTANRVTLASESEEEHQVEVKRLNKKKKFGRIRKIQKSDSDTDSEREIVHRLAETVNSVASKSKTPVAKLAINSIPTRLTVDSGVRLTILNWTDWLRISPTGVKPVVTTRTFVPYGIDTKLPIYARGKVTI